MARIPDSTMVALSDFAKSVIPPDHWCIIVTGAKTIPPEDVAVAINGIDKNFVPEAMITSAYIIKTNEIARFDRDDRP
jgi:hypothetical protein